MVVDMSLEHSGCGFGVAVERELAEYRSGDERRGTGKQASTSEA